MATYMYMQTAEERAVASSRRPSLAGEVGCSRAALAAAGASTDGAGNGGAAVAICPRPLLWPNPKRNRAVVKRITRAGPRGRRSARSFGAAATAYRIRRRAMETSGVSLTQFP